MKWAKEQQIKTKTKKQQLKQLSIFTKSVCKLIPRSCLLFVCVCVLLFFKFLYHFNPVLIQETKPPLSSKPSDAPAHNWVSFRKLYAEPPAKSRYFCPFLHVFRRREEWADTLPEVRPLIWKNCFSNTFAHRTGRLTLFRYWQQDVIYWSFGPKFLCTDEIVSAQ